LVAWEIANEKKHFDPRLVEVILEIIDAIELLE